MVNRAMPDDDRLGALLHERLARLYPIPRSLTGAGVRRTLQVLQESIPLEVRSVASGTTVFDWVVPPEWNLREAYIADRHGQRIIDTRHSALHLLGYSEPIDREVTRDELQEHLFSLPDHPDWIPYRTSYYQRRWGFCVSERQRALLTDERYHVVIDATLAPGRLEWGELLLPGATDEELLISAHICHPALANDNLSGIVVATRLAEELLGRAHRYSYRFLFAPGTIGALAWLAQRGAQLATLRWGLTLACLGDGAPLCYKRSFHGRSYLDRLVARIVARHDASARLIDFDPFGYDERQYNSPGFRLAVGALTRSRHAEYPQYHSSADDRAFVQPQQLVGALDFCRTLIDELEQRPPLRTRVGQGEPQLGRRGLLSTVGGNAALADETAAQLWVLALADGEHGVDDVAQRSGLGIPQIEAAVAALRHAGLLE